MGGYRAKLAERRVARSGLARSYSGYRMEQTQPGQAARLSRNRSGVRIRTRGRRIVVASARFQCRNGSLMARMLSQESCQRSHEEPGTSNCFPVLPTLDRWRAWPSGSSRTVDGFKCFKTQSVRIVLDQMPGRSLEGGHSSTISTHRPHPRLIPRVIAWSEPAAALAPVSLSGNILRRAF